MEGGYNPWFFFLSLIFLIFMFDFFSFWERRGRAGSVTLAFLSVATPTKVFGFVKLILRP